jgi:hypothetical protein
VDVRVAGELAKTLGTAVENVVGGSLLVSV